MKKEILIVDDAAINRVILSEMLQEDYTIIEAENGEQALKTIGQRRETIAAILLDLMMPGINGFQILEFLNREKIIGSIPVLVISTEDSVDNEKKCYELGVSDFIAKPFNNMLVRKRVRNAVEFYSYKNELEQKVAKQTRVLQKAYRVLELQAKSLQKRNDDIIEILGTVVEYRNMESGEHIRRVKKYTKILGDCFRVDYPEYKLSEQEVDIIVSASALHDIGKIAIPDSILLKPGRLTPDEYEYMKSHTVRGCEILDTIKHIWDENYAKASYEICRYHHERYDGRGYPDNLVGDQIPISAQLVSVADVYDALVSERCYKEAFDKEEAYHMIINGECGVFSPKLMEIFRKVKDQFENIASAQSEAVE